jgi:hypothetical protein
MFLEERGEARNEKGGMMGQEGGKAEQGRGIWGGRKHVIARTRARILAGLKHRNDLRSSLPPFLPSFLLPSLPPSLLAEATHLVLRVPASMFRKSLAIITTERGRGVDRKLGVGGREGGREGGKEGDKKNKNTKRLNFSQYATHRTKHQIAAQFERFSRGTQSATRRFISFPRLTGSPLLRRRT